MTNKIVTFLETIGKDFEKGIAAIDPAFQEVLTLADDAMPELMMVNPAVGALAKTTLAVIASTEQKFAAIGKQTGTGAQKFAEALTILSPVVSQGLAAAGKPSAAADVSKYVQAGVNYLNGLSPVAPPIAA